MENRDDNQRKPARRDLQISSIAQKAFTKIKYIPENDRRQQTMNVKETEIPGCLIIEPDVYGDERGFFMELYRESRYREQGIETDFVQDNYSRSRMGTLRGMHYQLTSPQSKLVQVVSGAVFDVAVDLRQDSPTFGKWFGMTLTAESHQQLFIPTGCAHGFYVLSDPTDFLYKCSTQYDAQDERVLLWNDSDLNIKWPLEAEPIVSEKDQQGTPFRDCEKYSQM